MTTKKLNKKLYKIAKEVSDSLKKEVAIRAIEYGSVTNFFSDLFNYGCQSGMIGGLIYFKDTHAFYDKYYDQIEELREQFEQDT